MSAPRGSNVDLLEGHEPVPSVVPNARPRARLRQVSRATKTAERVESLDFDLHETYVTMRKEQTRTKTGNKLRALRRWMLIALIGVTVGLVGVLVSYLSRYLSSWRNGTFLHLFALEHEKKLKEGTALGVLLGISCSYVLLASWMVAYVEPAGAGSGIPEVKCLLNGIELPRMMSLRTLIVKVLGMTLSTTSGLAVGREGPMVHAGAMVAANVARGFTLCGCARFDEFGSDVEVRGAVSCGTASGLAAAFNAPVGGLLLVIEEGISFWSAQLTWRVVFTAMLAAYIVAVLQSTVHIAGTPTVGPFGNLNNPGLFSFGTFDNSNNSYRIYDLPLFLAVGAAGGLFGIVFNALASSVATWRATYVGGPRPCCCCARPREPVWYLRPFCWVGWCPATTEEELVEARASDSATPLLATSDAADDGALGNTTPNTTSTNDGDDAVTSTSSVSSSTSLSASIVASRRNLCAGARTGDAAIPFKKLADAVIVTAIVVLIEYWLTIEAGECLRIPRGTPKTPPQYLGGLQQFNCRPDHYNDLATFFFNTPDEVIHLLFHYQDGPIMQSWKLVLCFLVYSAIMLLGYGVAVPAGLLVPPLVAGAAVGRAIGQGFHFRGWPLAAYGTYSLIGAAAVLGGVTRSTVFLAVMLMECTSTVVFALPLILALTAARYTGNLANHGLFEMHIAMKGYPYLEEKPRQAQAAKLTAADVMVPYSKLVCLGEVVVVASVLGALSTNHHHAFPVLFDKRRREGPNNRIGSFAGIVHRRELLGLLLLRKFYRIAPSIEHRTSSASAGQVEGRHTRVGTSGSVQRDVESGGGRIAGESSGADGLDGGGGGGGGGQALLSTPLRGGGGEGASEEGTASTTESEDWTHGRLGVTPARDEEDGEMSPNGRSGSTGMATMNIGTSSRRLAAAAAATSPLSAMLSTTTMLVGRERGHSEPLLPQSGPVVGFDFTGEPLATDDDIHHAGAESRTALERARSLLNDDDLHCILDLRPFLNATPFTIHVHAPLARVYRLFRGLGLRHLVCVDDAHDVVGIITRHCLTESALHDVQHKKRSSTSGYGPH